MMNAVCDNSRLLEHATSLCAPTTAGGQTRVRELLAGDQTGAALSLMAEIHMAMGNPSRRLMSCGG